MLRAQIKPHFFLNAITTVSNMTWQNRLEDIRSYLLVLAKYVRYILNAQCQRISIAEEISHIGDYIRLQEIRFPGSIEVQIDCAPDVKDTQIPYLLLFTLVENAFKHAMSLYETMRLRIRCGRQERDGLPGCMITVEDNGVGFPPGTIEEFNADTEEITMTKDHLGLSNIRYTLQLTYQRTGLLHLSNIEGSGARVEVWIPEQEGDAHETADL